MTWKETKQLIAGDMYRVSERPRKNWFTEIGMRYMFYFRLVQYTKQHMVLKPIDLLLKCILLHLQHKYGIQIPHMVVIGKGFYIGHYGTIVVNGKARIGNNVNISHGVTIASSNRGKKAGVPTIGNEVYIGPGAKIIGKITIGNNVAIGANAVVTKDVPNNACVAGVPAKIISMQVAEGYINRTV
jgi:serine O-acetyltransferase